MNGGGLGNDLGPGQRDNPFCGDRFLIELEESREVWRNRAVADCNFVISYFRLSADHRLLFGGRVSYTTMMPPNLPGAMRRSMLGVFPVCVWTRELEDGWEARVEARTITGATVGAGPPQLRTLN